MILLLWTSSLLNGCISLQSEDTYPEIFSPNLASFIRSKSGIELPKTYQNLQAYEDKGRNRQMRFNFRMQRSELDRFIKATKFQGKLERNPDKPQTDDPRLTSWFKPARSKNYLAGEYFASEENLLKKIVIVLDEEAIATVYIQVIPK